MKTRTSDRRLLSQVAEAIPTRVADLPHSSALVTPGDLPLH